MLNDKYNRLQGILKELGSVLVAYSGGVDSTLLAKVAVDTLGGDNVLACIATGPHQPSTQLPNAEKTATQIGVNLKIVELDVLSNEEFTANTPDRCFHCKSDICEFLIELAKKESYNQVIFGGNADDYSDFRPGHKAMVQYNIRNPLAEAGLTKSEIRQLSRRLYVPTAEMPANPCLVSRMQYGMKMTKENLKQIDEAEDYLKTLALVEFRVRHHDTIARIEVKKEDFDKIASEPNRSKINDKLKSLGFKYVTIDLQGFRSGSLNETLTNEQKQQAEE